MPPHLADLFKIPEAEFFLPLLFHAYNDLMVEREKAMQEIHADFYLRGFREKQTISAQLQ